MGIPSTLDNRIAAISPMLHESKKLTNACDIEEELNMGKSVEVVVIVTSVKITSYSLIILLQSLISYLLATYTHLHVIVNISALLNRG